MPDETSERQCMQDRIIQSMKDFAAENPTIAEAMAAAAKSSRRPHM